MQELQVFLVGGWGGDGRRAAEAALQALHALPARLHVALACVGRLNKDAGSGGVLRRELAVDVATLTAHPGTAQAGPPARRFLTSGTPPLDFAAAAHGVMGAEAGYSRPGRRQSTSGASHSMNDSHARFPPGVCTPSCMVDCGSGRAC